MYTQWCKQFCRLVSWHGWNICFLECVEVSWNADMFTKFIMLAPIGFDLLNGILCPGLSFSFPPLFSTVSPYACSYLHIEWTFFGIPNWSYYRQNEHFLHFTQDELVGFSIKLTNLFPIGYSLLPCAGTTKGSPSIMSMDFALILLVFFAEGQMVLPLMLPPLWRWSIYIPFS